MHSYETGRFFRRTNHEIFFEWMAIVKHTRGAKAGAIGTMLDLMKAAQPVQTMKDQIGNLAHENSAVGG